MLSSSTKWDSVGPWEGANENPFGQRKQEKKVEKENRGK